MAHLILIRHGQSQWNKKGLWTGLTDIYLSKEGQEEAKKAASVLKDIKIDVAFTSPLIRAKETFKIIKDNLGIKKIRVFESHALNERDYGDLTGKNKWEIQKEYGDEEFQKIRRGWDYPIPHGETLKDVYNRVVPYYKNSILPKLQKGKNVIISAHGNSLRALIKYLEGISDKDVQTLEIGTGEVYLYNMGENGNVISKEIKLTNPKKV